jgi:hypothetical protein
LAQGAGASWTSSATATSAVTRVSAIARPYTGCVAEGATELSERVPPVAAPDAVLRAYFFSADAVFWRWRAFRLILPDTSQELALGFGVTPGIGLEPPAPDRLDQCGEVTIVAGLLIRRIQFGIVTPPADEACPLGWLRSPREDRSESYCLCVGEDHVVALDFRTGSFIGPVVHLARGSKSCYAVVHGSAN